jgi:Amt family ammonium transporter
MAALIIGFVAGLVCYWAVAVLKSKLGYDDSLDAFGVHGVGGTVGAVLTGVFASASVQEGVTGMLEGNSGQLVNNILGVLVTWVLAAIGTLVILKVTDMTVGLRVTDAEELEGLDLTQHGEEAYRLEG